MICDSLYTHTHTQRESETRQNTVSSAYSSQVHGPKHTPHPSDSVFWGTSACAHLHTHMPFVVARAPPVTSSWGEFISDQSAAAQRLFCLPFAWNSLNSQITFQPQVFVYRSLNLQVFIMAARRLRGGSVLHAVYRCWRSLSESAGDPALCLTSLLACLFSRSLKQVKFLHF